MGLFSSQEVVFTPYVGQIFKSDDEAFEYYSNFARKNGFSIRKARSTESQNLGVYRRDFVCYRSGFNQPRKKTNVEHQRERKSVRCGCDAKLYLTKEIVDGVPQWYISQFSNVHNHELLEDDQVRLFPAYRKIEEADQEHILLLSKAGFPVNRIVKVLELEKGVQPGQLPFIEKDVRNFVRSCKKTVQENDSMLTMKRDNDLMELLEACKVTAERDEGFVYNFTMDDNGKVENIAWTYGDSIRAFSLFGDVVTIETSYHSITYSMILGMWLGIDNHGRPIFFGCTLLQDETSKSFSWALQVFVKLMRGRRPHIVVTDMDSGLRDALETEMPNTKQVICISQILSKMSSWFSFQLGMQYLDFKSEFDMLCHLENVEDFEHQWNNLVGIAAKFGSENREVMLYLPAKTCLPLEEHARTVLTPFAFSALQHEIMLSMHYAMIEMSNGSYLVRHYKKMERECLVIWIPDDEQVHCSCKEFEHSGLLCRHSIRVLVVKNYFQIPEKYFLLRWRLENSLVPLHDQIITNSNDECSQAFQSLTTALFSESFISKERFNFVHGELTHLLEHVRGMPVGDQSISPDNIVKS
ncbi:hypothetical protein BUALT_Bualt03G0226400 [Buddleja alternifolia]|uniref:Protein FAR1-RELATED SEQUENCE n=1 Tax=Buddleja alternifolia TaxID=168488 RepID=A0AAV6XWP3_9LAMI|nr:hypothetical protein BUALT_Bualt03G0226400 [Buddleja alternifolia]